MAKKKIGLFAMERYDAHNFDEGVHTIEILLQLEDYTGSCTVEIGGNCKGWGILDGCVDWLRYEDHEEGDVIILKNPDGDEIELDIDEVPDYVVGVRIVDFKPE